MDISFIYGLCLGTVVGASLGLLILALCYASGKGERDEQRVR